MSEFDVEVVPVSLATWNAMVSRIAELEERVEELEKAQRWIPVSEQLPGVYDFVIAHNTHYKNSVVSPAQYNHAKCIWYDIQDVRVDGSWEELPCVAHWMPLPAPPEGQGK